MRKIVEEEEIMQVEEQELEQSRHAPKILPWGNRQ
jgi:hypothetical protein